MMLSIDSEIIRDILDKIRQFQAKEEVSFPEVTDDMDSSFVLADYEDDAIFQEAASIINNLRIDQQATLVALMYLGRGDYTIDEWEEALSAAESDLSNHTGQYLLSRPLATNDIEQGLEMQGVYWED